MADFIVVNKSYENTGGGCMCTFFDVYVPEKKQTFYVIANEEGASIYVADYFHGDFDLDPFECFIIDLQPEEQQTVWFEIAKHCVNQFLQDDKSWEELPAAWLTEEEWKTIPADYAEYYQYEYEDDTPWYPVNGREFVAPETYLWWKESQERPLSTNLLKRDEETDITMVAAFKNLSMAWEYINNQWSLYSDILDNADYPFDKSFDELQIPAWCQDIAHRILQN